ncbi:MAG: hydantoinase/oxoprolinase family protein [Aquificae bacterium]|nr:hydantoinase/oxoprolinase family protein [Aquificota bacterium]
MIKVGVDTGGTFTDFVYHKDGKWYIFKVLSTPSDPSKAVLEGLQRIGTDQPLAITHGSTVATNSVLERKGARTSFITNKGFEDTLFIGRQDRKKLYDLTYRRKPPLVNREDCIGLDCRVNSEGKVVKPVDEGEVREVAKQLKEKGIQAVAVSFLFSFLNPTGEETVKRILEEEGFFVSVSSQIIPEFREYERGSTTVVNSYVMPKMNSYIKNLQENLKEGDSLSIIQSNGGAISPDTARKEPVRTILSGPAGGVVGAFHLGKLIGKTKLITFDMGGTSTDVSLLNDSIPFSTETYIDDFPVKVPIIDIHTVGAGGGSIAYLDKGGSLNVGPESAGADPGPVCYGKGERLTVSDANLFLGRLSPDYFLGGSMKLNMERLYKFFELYSIEWGIPADRLAEGILKVANTKMERAVRVISIEKGYDPREFSLFVYGGAGGLHAPFLARELSIPEVIIPLNPGVFSAFGMAFADVIKDYSLTVMSEETDINRLKEAFGKLEERALTDMEREGFKRADVEIHKLVDLRYKGQSFEIVIPFSDRFVEDFHSRHKALYGYSRPEKQVQVVNLRVRAVGQTEKPQIQLVAEGDKQPPPEAVVGRKKLIFDGKEYETTFYLRDKLKAGNRIKGSAVILEYSSTTVIPPFAEGYIDQYGNIRVKV